MSARPCGCDEAAGWLCATHAKMAELLRTASRRSPSVQQFEQRLADADTMADTVAPTAVCDCTGNWICAIHRPPMGGWHHPPLSPAQQRTHKEWLLVVDDLTQQCGKLHIERERIAAILATFYRAEWSLSSLQPLMALALELNPDLVEQRR